MKIISTALLFVVIGVVIGLPVERGSFSPGSVAQAAASASAQSNNNNRLTPPPPPRDQYNYHRHHSNPYGNNRQYGTRPPQFVPQQRPRSFGPGPGPVPQIVLPHSEPRNQGSSSKAVAIAKSADGKSIAIATSNAG